MMIVGILLAGTSWSSFASSPAPQNSSVSLSGTMPAKAPQNAPTITSPRSGTAVNTLPLGVSGTCGDGTIIELFDNDIFAGSTPCSSSHIFELSTNLLYGSNILVVRGYDALDQSSPNSNSVIVNYTATPPGLLALDSSNHLANQLLLQTNAVIRGVEPNVEFSLPLQLIGGNAPYSLNVDWGVDQPDLVARPSSAPISLVHVYKRPGTFQVTIRASDLNGQTALLSVVTIVNGKSNVIGSSTASGGTSSNTGLNANLLIAWPLYVLGIVAMLSFWLGEMREKSYLTKLAA